MSDENRDTESGDTGFAAPPGVGTQLKAAREAKQLSVGDIAMTLKLGARQVEALENGEWQKLPGQTFIRGFVRNYARLLQVDAAPLMAQLDAVLESPQQRLALPEHKEKATMPQTGRPARRDSAMIVAGAVLVAVAAGIYFLWPADFSEVRNHLEPVFALLSKKEPPATPAPAPAAEPVFPPGSTPQQIMNPQAVTPPENGNANPPATPAPALAPPSVLQAPEPAAPAQAPSQAAAPAPTPAQPAATAAAPSALHFAFEQESWVEVRDRHGKVLFSKRNAAGTEQDVAGDGPFALVVGNAPGVKLSLRGQPVDLASHTQGKVARLNLE